MYVHYTHTYKKAYKYNAYQYTYTTYPVLHASIPQEKTHDRVRYKYTYVDDSVCSVWRNHLEKASLLIIWNFYLFTL